MKVVLIYPGITSCGFKSKDKSSESTWISHGLCYLGANAVSHGYEVELIDLRRLNGWDHFIKEIERINPSVAGITMMTVDYEPAMEAVKIIKDKLPQIKIIAGGVHPTIGINELKEDPRIDHIITGEGEISFVELLNDIKDNKNAPKVIQGKTPELDKLPMADRNLFTLREQPIGGQLPEPFFTLIAGRGCIYNCSFCQPAEKLIFGKKVRRRSVDNVIEELKYIRDNYGFNSFLIHDDCLTEDRDWIMEFCRKYKENGFKQTFACQSRADIICRNEDMVKELADAGLSLFLIGFESGNQRILNFLRKGTKVEHNLKAAKICRKYNIRIWANYMMGIPTETKEEVLDTVNMIKEIAPDVYSPAYYTPHPGSDLFEYCEKHGLSLVKDHSGYRRNATEPKIKDVDYVFLDKAVEDSMRQTPVIKARKFYYRVRKKLKTLSV
ncbi:MAG: radical SAM protein [Armatimonadota bacterium]